MGMINEAYEEWAQADTNWAAEVGATLDALVRIDKIEFNYERYDDGTGRWTTHRN